MEQMKNQNLFIFNFKIWKIILFSGLTFYGILRGGEILQEYNDVKKRWNFFYELPRNSLDILILGNSHAYSTYDPKIIDAICYTNSFVIASNSQKIEQTYFNLKEALSNQNPKLVVIQLSILTGDSWKNQEADERVYSNLDGMQWNFNKIEAIINQRPSKDYINALFPLLRSHQNWKNTELVHENLIRIEENEKEDYSGFSPRESEMGEHIKAKYLLAEKEDFKNFQINSSDIIYLKKIQQLSKQENFKIIYVMSPKFSNIINNTYKYKYQKINQLISSFGAEYLDFNQLNSEIGLTDRNFENGFISYQHTSHFGANQISIYLSNYLKEHHDAILESDLHNDFWLSRMNKNQEFYIFNPKSIDKATNNYIELAKNKEFFPEIHCERIFLVRSKAGLYEFVITFSKSLDIELLTKYKMFVHLYPSAGDIQLREDRIQYGFENFDFTPKILPHKNGYYISHIIDTDITEIDKLNIGLFKSGLKKSNVLTFNDLDLLQ